MAIALRRLFVPLVMRANVRLRERTGRPLHDDDAPPPRRRPPCLSIALWLPAVVGLALAIVLAAFTLPGIAAPGFPALSGGAVDQAGIIPADHHRLADGVVLL